MLFGKIEDEEWEEEKNVFDDDSYQIRRYSLINKPSPKIYEDKKHILISILSPLATAQIINEFSVSPGDERGV